MPDFRFGVSLLSKENYNTAYNEEVMIDKNTGEVLIKTRTGDTISYNYNSRLTTHLESIKRAATEANIYGNIFNITFDDKSGPFVMTPDTNYLLTPVYIPAPDNVGYSKVMFSVDIDSITELVTGISYEKNNVMVEIAFDVTYNNGSSSLNATISNHANGINTVVYNLKDGSTLPASNLRVTGINLTSFMIRPFATDHSGTVSIDTTPDNIRHILNSVFMILEK